METLAVDYTVTGIEPVHGAGRLIALANAELTLCGIPIVLQGIRIDRHAAGSLIVQAPQFRDPAGTWRSSIVLPDALRDALGAEVLAAWRATGA